MSAAVFRFELKRFLSSGRKTCIYMAAGKDRPPLFLSLGGVFFRVDGLIPPVRKRIKNR